MTNLEKARLFRKRFYGRQDVYGKGKVIQRDDGSTFKQYYPVCQNFWSDDCRIKTKTGGCGGCQFKAHEPVTDETVLRHILGQEEQIVYVLNERNKIRFMAMDFDCKPGKERIAYTFEDVKKVIQVLKELKINYGVARSTTAGFHVYIFFNEEASPAKARAVAFYVFERTGFMEEHRQNIRPIPEVFPKSVYVSADGIGNGIKCAPIESRFEVERNCFVTDENSMLPADLQWEYFAKIPDNSPKILDEIIEANQLEVYDDEQTAGNDPLRSLHIKRGPRGKWEPPLTGSIEKTLEGCAALRRVKQKCLRGDALSHHEGFALFHVAMNTADGLDWFQRYSGWGKTEQDQRQLEQSIRANYSPWTCRKMQENGVCNTGTKCFDKKPPIQIIDGEVTIRKDVPENEWPEPSPIRYAFGRGEDFLAKLMKEAEDLTVMTDAAERATKIREIADRAQVFDENQQSDLLTFMVDKKLGKKKDLQTLFRKAGKEHEEEIKQAAANRTDMVAVGKLLFKKLQPFGYATFQKLKGDAKVEIPICHFDIRITEERAMKETNQSTFVGVFEMVGYKREFQMDSAIWADNGKFYEFFKVLLQSRFRFSRNDVDILRQACEAFSDMTGIERSTFGTEQGWIENGSGELTFVTPDYMVDKEGVRPNKDHKLSLAGKGHASKLNFKMLDDSTFRDVMFHIKADLWNAYPKDMMYTGFAHTFLAPLKKPLGITVSPTLFYEGLTGSGKTKMSVLFQNFFGEFGGPLLYNSTGKAIMEEGYDFKDCLLVVDDYKETDLWQRKAAEDCIQYSYDEGSRSALKQSGQKRSPRAPRGIFMMSGELIPSNEASLIARTILVETQKRDMTGSLEQYNRCAKEYARYYSGVTPRFIHFVLAQDLGRIKTELDEMVYSFMLEIKDAQNAARIATNLGLNFMVWKLFIRFMLATSIVTENEADNYLQEHLEIIKSLLGRMALRCRDEQNGVVFVETLREMLFSEKVSIRGLTGYNHDKVPVVGFTKPDEENVVYLFPQITFEQVKSNTRSSVLRGNVQSFGKQLEDLGLTARRGASRVACDVYFEGGTRRVWALHLDKLGLTKKQSQFVVRTPSSGLGKDGII